MCYGVFTRVAWLRNLPPLTEQIEKTIHPVPLFWNTKRKRNLDYLKKTHYIARAISTYIEKNCQCTKFLNKETQLPRLLQIIKTPIRICTHTNLCICIYTCIYRYINRYKELYIQIYKYWGVQHMLSQGIFSKGVVSRRKGSLHIFCEIEFQNGACQSDEWGHRTLQAD